MGAAWANKRANAKSRPLTSICPAWLTLSKDKTRYEVIAKRAQIVRSIFEDSAAGMGNYSITRRLNQSRVPHFGRSRGWCTSYVSNITINRSVLGEFQPHQIVNGKRVPVGSTIPNYFPAIVDEDLFYRVQALRRQRKISGSGRKGLYVSNLFTRLATCAYCGSPMRFENKGYGPNGGTYLSCDNSRRGLGCERVGWRYEDFETLFLAFVHDTQRWEGIADCTGQLPRCLVPKAKGGVTPHCWVNPGPAQSMTQYPRTCGPGPRQ